MNIKSLLIGSAAALAAVSGAKAADAIVAAEPEPLEYVRVCDAFGAGFFYIPGTETCLKFDGYVRFQTGFGRDSSGTSDWDLHARQLTGTRSRALSSKLTPAPIPSSALCAASSASAATLTTALLLLRLSSLTRLSSNSAA